MPLRDLLDAAWAGILVVSFSGILWGWPSEDIPEVASSAYSFYATLARHSRAGLVASPAWLADAARAAALLHRRTRQRIGG